MSEPSNTNPSTLERSAPVILGCGALLWIVFGVATAVTVADHDNAVPLSLEMMLIAFGSTGVLGGLLLYGVRIVTARVQVVKDNQVQLGARVAANTTALHGATDALDVLQSKVDSSAGATAGMEQAVTELGKSYTTTLHRIAASRINGAHLVAVGGQSGRGDG